MTADSTAELRETMLESGVAILELNRPQARNALSRELTAALATAVARLWEAGARVMVLSASAPGFCAGADLKQRRTMSDAEKYAHNRAINALANQIAALPIPTIAALNGVALGGGCELALACDLRLASASASIGLTESRLGAIPGAGGTQRLPRLIGVGRALELMYTGDPVGAAQAAQIGLVNEVVDDERLEARVLELAGRIAGRSRHAAQLLKQVVYAGIERPLAAGLELEGAAVATILASDDYREGLAAFAEKRPPRFS